MKMLKWMLRVSLRQENKRCGVVDIVEEMKEAGLRWTEHVIRKEEEAPRITYDLEIEGQRASGRSKWKWEDVQIVVKADMEKRAC